ncbi:hypothetical protein LL033_11830 [Clostridium estertheticum]|uniref:hypothetical protein n=1 Tax=Clostridium estertheticum TaxID=238834 RepID=UPI001C0D48A6|nr:hypothetical protein [Clostridium estertheticum]MBU3215841.1 hypothetical protein [Clostridium estertheticum]WAG57796.1 hypothetical protein LL033_11830 [Clostridium estertheticum]
MSYDEENNLIKRNENENLIGEIKCQVCNKNYNWEENVNADAIVKNISTIGQRGYIDLEITSKCSYCNYKTKHYHNERNDSVI